MTNKAGRWLFLLAMGTVAAALLGLCFGANPLSPAELFALLSQGDTAHPLYRILVYVRLPRVCGALLAGSALSTAGAILQVVLNNPLASPNIIGVNTGAGLAVLIVSALIPGSLWLLPLSAFAGALLAAALVLLIAVRSELSPLTLVLTGVALSGIFSAGMSAILILYPDAYVGAGAFLAGSLSALTMKRLLYPALAIVLALAAALLLGKTLNLLSLGADTASSLGLPVRRARLTALIVAAALAGSAVSFAGLLGFVGLIVPHAVRFLLGYDHRLVLPLSALGGASLVTLCDLLARTLFAPYELPVGILLSLIGGIFFLILMLRMRRKNYA
jgi:iron complex transport system permease protein